MDMSMIPVEVQSLFQQFEAAIHDDRLAITQAVDRMEQLDIQANTFGYTFICDLDKNERRIEVLKQGSNE